MSAKSKILGVREIDQKIKRLAWQLYENNVLEKEIIVVGISERGLILAKQLAAHIQEISKIKTKLAHLELDKDNPYNKEVTLNLEEKEYVEKVVILVDDVLNSGKTMIYGVKHFLNAPVKKINTTALIDRMHHRFPIRTDYAGLVLSTSMKDHVAVELGPNEGVYVE